MTQPTQPRMTCQTCGRTYSRKPGTHQTHAAFKRRRFCSRTCADTRPLEPLATRIKRYMEPGEGGCIEWTGALNPSGYGAVGIGSRADGTIPAHVASYEVAAGPVPSGMVLDHLCRNPKCVNPDHLEPVTLAENSRRGARARITRQDAEQIKLIVERGRTQASVAAEYELHPAHVSRIVNGRRWADESLDKPIAYRKTIHTKEAKRARDRN